MNIPTLQAAHKQDFSKEEWQLIVLFESHFHKQVNNHEEYLQQTKQKWDYCALCLNTCSISKLLVEMSPAEISTRANRIAAGRAELMPVIREVWLHNSTDIDHQLLK